jgi:hypothetical protein
MKKLLPAMLASVLIFIAGCDNVTVSQGGLSVEDPIMSVSENGPAAADRKFQKGVPIFIKLTVKGIKQADDTQVWVQQDLAVNGPDGKSVLNKENMVDLHSKAPEGTNQVTLNNDLTLPADAPAGAYEATVSVRDKVSGGTTKTTLKFTVEG